MSDPSLCCVALSTAHSLITRRGNGRCKAKHANGDSRASRRRQRATMSTSAFCRKSLISRCQVLIESFHDIHGYPCLPDILWKAGLGPFIQRIRCFASCSGRPRRPEVPKNRNAGFVRIASSILSLEILASRFAGWSSIYPREAATGRGKFSRPSRAAHKYPLIEFYLYPPKYLNSPQRSRPSRPPQKRLSTADDLWRFRLREPPRNPDGDRLVSRRCSRMSSSRRRGPLTKYITFISLRR